MDEESLQTSERRRGSCLDVFLVASILLLFVTVAAVAAGGAVAVMGLRSTLLDTSKTASATSDETCKMSTGFQQIQTFVHLDAISSDLNKSLMQWAPVNKTALNAVGSNYYFDEKQRTLKANQAGAYFMYIDLNFTCTYACGAGHLRVSVGDVLTCDVQLPELADVTPVTRKCWTVRQLNGEELVARLTLQEGLENWKLELSGSGFGMYLLH